MRTETNNLRQKKSQGCEAVPEAWLACVQEFARLAESHATGEDTRRWRDQIRQTIAAQQKQLHVAPKVAAPPGIPPELEKAVNDTLRYLREDNSLMLEKLQAAVEDFQHAAENEDRFVVLAFGRVKAGKSALANHMAGLDFGLSPGSCGECFVEDESVPFLKEAPTECTHAYQGFRLPGLLWIDCPGAGSTTFANGELARRLVARADFILFVTPSDAPGCASELRELYQLIRDSGNQALEGLFVVTRSDKIDRDLDPETEEFIRRVVPKSLEVQREQARWVHEQVVKGGLGEHLQGRAPLAVSVYVARDRLGLDWVTARPQRPLAVDWATPYEASGIPELCHYLGNLVCEHGVRLKNLWPKKRLHAIQRLLQETADRAGKRLGELRAANGRQRQLLKDAEKSAADDAAQLAAGQVGQCLKRWGTDDLGRFNRTAAILELQTLLRNAVLNAVSSTVEPLLGRAFKEMDAALVQFAATSQFNLELRQKTRRQTYTTTHRAASIGRAVGGIWGTCAGFLFGTLLLPGIGTFAGAFFGGLFGSFAGGQIGPSVWEETRTVEIPIGTNADEVICQTEQAIRRQAKEVVAEGFRRLDQSIFAPLDQELARLESEVSQWPLKG